MSAEQTKQLEQALRPVAGRLRQAALRPQLVRALFLAAGVALVPALLRLATGSWLWGVAALVLFVAVPVAILGRLLAKGPDLRRAALAVDKHYQWQDRISTAWSALSLGGMTPLEQYQAADAAKRVSQVVPVEVVPLKMPTGIPRACGLALLVLCALLWPIRYHKGPVKPQAAVLIPVQVATPDKPVPIAVPAVSPAVAAASLSQVSHYDSNPDQFSLRNTPAPDRRLIHDYFEAVCLPGR